MTHPHEPLPPTPDEIAAAKKAAAMLESNKDKYSGGSRGGPDQGPRERTSTRTYWQRCINKCLEAYRAALRDIFRIVLARMGKFDRDLEQGRITEDQYDVLVDRLETWRDEMTKAARLEKKTCFKVCGDKAGYTDWPYAR
jgi:hypothetical protein